MKPFIPCSNPYLVPTSKGSILVPCGHCIPCKVEKQKHYSLLLQLETQLNKYCEMITLTYSPAFVPYIDVSESVDNSTCRFDSLCYMVRFGKRYKGRYDPITNKVNFVFDKDSSRPRPHFFCLDDFQKGLDLYRKRVAEYNRRYPSRSGHSLDRVRILWYNDVLKFHDRLRNYVKKEYNTSFRYFTVGEYGTNGLQPHWHILLFHNSDKLHRDFVDVVDLPGHTSRRPVQCSRKFYLRKLWTYGNPTTTTTDGFIADYLAGYVNQHSCDYSVLAKFPQKCFHSVLLGVKNKEFAASLFQKRRFKELAETFIVNKRCVKKCISEQSSLYSLFAIRFTGSSNYSLQQTAALLRAANYYLSKISPGIDIYDDHDIYNSLFDISSVHCIIDSINPHYAITALRTLKHYVDDVCMPKYFMNSSVNSLKSLFYASRKIYKITHQLGLSCIEYYLKLLSDFSAYRGYLNLVEQFSMLETDSNYAYQYYSAMDFNLGTFNVTRLKGLQLYRKMQLNYAMEYDSNIKHRSVAQSYKNYE